MRRILNPLIALSVVAAFTLSAVLCCCAMQMNHASSFKNTNKMASDPCQRDSSSQKKPNSQGYCFLNAPVSDTVRAVAVVVLSFHDVFHFPETVIAFGRDIHQASSLVGTAYGGIRLSQAQPIPIYLQIRNLRL